MKRAVPLILVTVLLAVPPGTAVAQDTTVPAAPTTVPEAAVPVGEEAPAADDAAWTFRFIVPTLAVLAVALLVGISAAYHMRLRNRYRVVR